MCFRFQHLQLMWTLNIYSDVSQVHTKFPWQLDGSAAFSLPLSPRGRGSRCASISSTPQLRGSAFLSDDDAFPLGPAVCLDMPPPQLQCHIKGRLPWLSAYKHTHLPRCRAQTVNTPTHTHTETWTVCVCGQGFLNATLNHMNRHTNTHELVA